jgi:dihydrofolate synthase/folylpolyglutamate synthase
MLNSEIILENIRKQHLQDIDLTLRPSFFELLKKLGDPHLKMPPTFHVAGTNGKGSTCAFLRAFLEAEGYKVHVYTSPHLVKFHERIRIAGSLITESELVDALQECKKKADVGSLSYFEIATAAAFLSFAHHKADYTVIEVGLGGRLDATNVIPKPLATVITRLSFDHRDYLGNTMEKIAYEKAGILRKNIPCFSASQPSKEALTTLRKRAQDLASPLYVEGIDWFITQQTNGFKYVFNKNIMDLPNPALLGQHQYSNASLALSALSVLPVPLSQTSAVAGVQKVYWPARLQLIKTGNLANIISDQFSLWLDGGHNDSAGEVLALQAEKWRSLDNKPLHLIFGMLNTKKPDEFLGPLKPYISSLQTISIPNEPLSLSADQLLGIAVHMGFSNVESTSTVEEALNKIKQSNSTGRILICGSLYLAGHILKKNHAI